VRSGRARRRSPHLKTRRHSARKAKIFIGAAFTPKRSLGGSIAPQKGDAGAARHLGVEYMDGKKNVVERDFEKARKFHLQAAQGGDARSMFDLGTIYEQG